MAVGVGIRRSAQAQPPLLNGTFSGAEGDPENIWQIASTCGPAGCAGTVASNQGWTSPMTLTNGVWYFSVTKPDGFICADGSFQPAVISMELDPATLRGVLSADSMVPVRAASPVRRHSS
ncbi:hypothetical protein A7U43_00010 [Mycobacterium adipatum]|uniref:Uncharacterized protein n=1 Tax=Mycobacterium adipatum TaxID=1682113 RepID=A0A172UFH7_9MYCO|nr:hypothetical protein [Mycobacterium adipatum]ANE77922.1 hypothetical protein A7U43_00010 [Mycobacterium adipatum]